MRLFITEGDVVVTKTIVDISGKVPKVIVKPDKRAILDTPLFGVTIEEREKFYDRIFVKYEKDVAREGITTIELTWRYWDYELKSNILKRSKIVNQVNGEETYDADLINRNKIRFLLKDWNITDEAGIKIPLVLEKGQLVESSFKKVLSLEPSLLQVILNQLDAELYLTKEEEEK